jgi:membrane protease YdiL (CAAX protease family)
VSVAIRLAYHLYQGPLAVIPIALFGVIVTVVYVRMGRLWPAIVAHGILDFVGLLADLV